MTSISDVFKQTIIINGINLLSDPNAGNVNQKQLEALKNSLETFCQTLGFGNNLAFLLAVHSLYLEKPTLSTEDLQKKCTQIQQEFLYEIAPKKISVKPENEPDLDNSDLTTLEPFAKAVSEIITLLNISVLPKLDTDPKAKMKKSLSEIATNTKDLAKNSIAFVNTLPGVQDTKKKLSQQFKTGMSSLTDFLNKKKPK